MILIIAGNADQAKACAATHKLQHNEWRYIYGVEALAGYQEPKDVWLVGNYDDRKDWNRLRMMIIAEQHRAQFRFITKYKPKGRYPARLQKMVEHSCGHSNHWLCHFCHGCGLILERGSEYDAKRK